MSNVQSIWNNVNHLKGVLGVKQCDNRLEPLVIDFAKKDSTLLIKNGTEHQKDSLVQELMMSIIYNSHEDQVQFGTVDFDKPNQGADSLIGLESQCPLTFSRTGSSYQKILNLVNEMSARLSYLQSKGYANINEFNQNEKRQLEHLVIVLKNLDTLANKFQQSTRNNIELELSELLSNNAKKVGMHFIVTMDEVDKYFSSSIYLNQKCINIVSDIKDNSEMKVTYKNQKPIMGKMINLQEGDYH